MIGQIFIKNLQIDFQSIKIISKIKEKFNLNSDIPTDFSGIPILNNQRAWFFGGGQDDIKNLWILFETALQFSEYPNDENRKKFCEIFDIVKQQRLIKWNITIGLFWVRPYSYPTEVRKKIIDDERLSEEEISEVRGKSEMWDRQIQH